MVVAEVVVVNDDGCDVAVLGGGAAGLSGALMLARARRSVLVIDAGAPRNAPAAGVHGLLARDPGQDDRVVAFEEALPRVIAELCGSLRGADEVGEQHRRQDTLECRLLSMNRPNEALDLAQ